TGMAAVKFAQSIGAEVFATASRAKWQSLSQLGVTRLMDSRSLDFADQVLEQTNGEGVHVVLNALTGEYVERGLEALSPGGRFVELGKRDVRTLEEIAEIRADVEYQVVDLMSQTQAAYADRAKEMPHLAERLESKIHLPRTAFPLAESNRAFEYMRRAQHIGKVSVRVDDARWPIRSDSSYLVTGGLGGLGISTATWLLSRGAEHISLLGRNTQTISGAADSLPEELRELRDAGEIDLVFEADVRDQHARSRRNDGDRPTIHILRCDVTDRRQLEDAIEYAHSIAPLRGVVHSAGVLLDATIRELTWDQMQQVQMPKAVGAKHLHELTAEMPLDFFVLYSSAASLFGSPGQASHVAANTYLDALAHHRRA
ncbi:MAG: KR domain-containing protein, partial [Planctomycetota bacterium]